MNKMFDTDGEHAKFEVRFKAIKLLVAFIFLCVFIGGASLIYVMVKATIHVEKHGLKPVLEEVWNGKDQSLPSSANTQQ